MYTAFFFFFVRRTPVNCPRNDDGRINPAEHVPPQFPRSRSHESPSPPPKDFFCYYMIINRTRSCAYSSSKSSKNARHKSDQRFDSTGVTRVVIFSSIILLVCIYFWKFCIIFFYTDFLHLFSVWLLQKRIFQFLRIFF